MVADRESDSSLVRRFRSGDDAAFDVLYERYRKSVYTSCYAVLVGEEPATELASATFAAALRELRAGRVPADLRLWLRETAHRLAVERADPRMSRPSGPVDIDPEWRVTSEERAQLIWDAVTSLSLSHRKVLSLRVPVELTAREIAGALGLDPKRAARLLEEAESELRRALIALVVARSGRRECGALDRLLAKGGWTAGPLGAESRLYRKVAGHVDKCAACGRNRQQRFVPAEWLPVVIPLLVVPYELRQRIMEEAQDLAVRVAGTSQPSVTAMSSSSALASTSVAPGVAQPLSKLAQAAQSGRAVVTTTVSRVAGSPAVTNLVHHIQSNPAMARVAGMVAALVIIGPIALVGSEPDPTEPQRQLAAPPSTTTTSPPPEPPPQWPPSPDTPVPNPPPADNPGPIPASNPIPSTVDNSPPSQPLPPAAPGDPPTNPPPEEPPPTDPPRVDPPVDPVEPPPGSRTGRPVLPPPPPEPPRWGYLRMALPPSVLTTGTEVRLTGEYQRGTWTAGRTPTVARESQGVHRIRMPGVGSAKGVAHVTVGWYGLPASCVVRDLEQSGEDELIWVGCFNAAGTPTDVYFHVYFGTPSVGPTPNVALRSDVPDTATITRLATGRYRVTVDGTGLKPTGYAQITPLGAKPVWCQNAGVDLAGGQLMIDVDCYNLGSATPADATWQLTYVQGATLTHDPGEPGAYAQTTMTAPGLRIDDERSYSSANGAMTVLRDGIGNYVVGFRGIGKQGNLIHVVALGPKLGFCRVESWWGTPDVVGELWVRVVCTADLPFGVAVMRSPGGPTGLLAPAPPPNAHPPGPKWAHARVNRAAFTIPLGVETEVDPDEQWGAWVRNLSQVDARWARRATVLREEPGLYRVRLPGVGSSGGFAHVTVGRTYTWANTCTVRDYWRDGNDELVRVACFDATPSTRGAAADAPFSVFFTAAGSGIRYTPTGGAAGVVRNGPGNYTATVSGAAFTGTGHVQITPITPPGATPTWCQRTSAEDVDEGTRIGITCWDFAKTPVQPHDSAWVLTYVQDTPLTNDPAVPGAYLRTSLTPPALAVDPTGSYSTGGARTVLRIETGRYWVGFKGLGSVGNTFQITTIGPTTGYCVDGGWEHYPDVGEVWVSVNCYNTARRQADVPFGIAAVHSPYGPRGANNPNEPGPHPQAPKWGYAYMHATDIPSDIETELNPGYPWGTWLGTLGPYAARWLERNTVLREEPGVSVVRLPNIGSAAGIPHVTVAGPLTADGDTCAVDSFWKEGDDERIRVRCYSGSGAQKDIRYSVFFGEPGMSGKPMITMRSDAPGAVDVERLSAGRYRATVDGAGLDARGYAQITALGAAPVRCRNAGIAMVAGKMRLDVACDTIGTAAPPTDTGWLLTYMERTPLNHDTRIPGAYVQTTPDPSALAVDGSRSYPGPGGPITFDRLGTGDYRIRVAGIGWPGANALLAGGVGQVVMLGSESGHCRLPGVGPQNYGAEITVTEVQVRCYDSSGRAADRPFGVAVVRRP